jgi:CRISPR-associated protein Cmr2
MTQYLALSIGPIYKTLQQARKTRELWAASYLFSTLMENLASELGSDEVLMPVVKIDKTKPVFGAGIFPDRLLMKAHGMTRESVEQKITQAIAKTAQAVFPEKKLPKNTIPFWKQFFRIVFVLRECQEMTGPVFLDEFVPILDSAELADAFFQNEPSENFLLKLMENVYETDISEVALKDMNRGRYEEIFIGNALFPSTNEVAAFGLFDLQKEKFKELQSTSRFEFYKNKHRLNPSEDETTFFYHLLENDPFWKEYRRPYHKYFCIVHADGDNISATLRNLKNDDNFKAYSKILNDFIQKSAAIINDFGGKPVYIGGDDLVFFAPVRTNKGSVLDLINELDAAYPSEDLHGSTLSFGMSISYHKFPLFEARDISARQLFDIAKKFKHDGKEKNALAITLIKHSGSQFGTVFSKGTLKELIAASQSLRLKNENADDTIEKYEELLSSLIYKLRTLEGLLNATLQHASDETRFERLETLIEKYFDTSHTAGKNLAEQQKAISNLIIAAWTEKEENDERKWFANLYCTLRLLKFLTDKT